MAKEQSCYDPSFSVALSMLAINLQAPSELASRGLTRLIVDDIQNKRLSAFIRALDVNDINRL